MKLIYGTLSQNSQIHLFSFKPLQTYTELLAAPDSHSKPLWLFSMHVCACDSTCITYFNAIHEVRGSGYVGVANEISLRTCFFFF